MIKTKENPDREVRVFCCFILSCYLRYPATLSSLAFAVLLFNKQVLGVTLIEIYNTVRLYTMAIGYLEVYLLDRTAAAPMIHYQNPFDGPQISIIENVVHLSNLRLDHKAFN